MFWVSRTTRYYDEKYPEHLITLNRDINAVDMSNIYPDELEQLYHPTKKDILFAKQYSQDAYAPVYVSFFRSNPNIDAIFWEYKNGKNEYIFNTTVHFFTVSELYTAV